jgi:hypothetical protein
VKLTTYIHLVPRLRMRGAIPPVVQFVSMALCLVKWRDMYNVESLPFLLLESDHW